MKGTTRPPLPQVPLEIWMCEEKQLVKHVEAWFLREQIGLRIESDLHEELLAAILATRHEHRSNPQSYAAKCFANGVAMGFQLSAQKLLGGPKNQYAAHG